MANSPFVLFLSKPASKFVSHVAPAGRDYILHHWYLGGIARDSARSSATEQKYNRSWTRWCSFASTLNFGGDPFMDRIKPEFRIILLVLFASSLRSAEHSRSHVGCMAKDIVRETLDQVGSTFQANFRRNPTRGTNNKLLPILTLQLHGCKRTDPKKSQQRCLNPAFIRQCLNRAVTKRQTIIAELIGLGFFSL